MTDRVEFYGGPLDLTLLTLPEGSTLLKISVHYDDKSECIAEYRPDEEDPSVWYIEETND